MNLWDDLLKEYDEIVHIPMSSSLSGSLPILLMMPADEYDGKVHVVDNQRISVTQRQSVLDAFQMAQKKVILELRLRKSWEATKGDSIIFITVDKAR